MAISSNNDYPNNWINNAQNKCFTGKQADLNNDKEVIQNFTYCTPKL